MIHTLTTINHPTWVLPFPVHAFQKVDLIFALDHIMCKTTNNLQTNITTNLILTCLLFCILHTWFRVETKRRKFLRNYWRQQTWATMSHLFSSDQTKFPNMAIQNGARQAKTDQETKTKHIKNCNILKIYNH